MAYFNQIVPYFSGGEEAFTACRPAADLRFFSLAQFNEFKDRLLNALGRIANASPESASIKWTLMNQICHQVVAYVSISAGSVERADASKKMRRNAPDNIPVSIIGRLAVSRSHGAKDWAAIF